MALTTAAALKIGPLVLSTAIDHFLERHKDSETRSKARDELLFDEGELQGHLTLSWRHLESVCPSDFDDVPMSSCS